MNFIVKFFRKHFTKPKPPLCQYELECGKIVLIAGQYQVGDLIICDKCSFSIDLDMDWQACPVKKQIVFEGYNSND